MGVSKKVIAKNDRLFQNTLGLINGRVYYNLKSWYHMLALLPGYNINARFMEKMMGVKERFDLPKSYRLTKATAWWSIVKMLLKMIWNFFHLSKKRRAFKQLLDNTISNYKAINYSKKTAHELMQLYLNFEQTLLKEWKAPLLNDFFAMIYFGLLQKRCKQYLNSDNPNIHNDLLTRKLGAHILCVSQTGRRDYFSKLGSNNFSRREIDFIMPKICAAELKPAIQTGKATLTTKVGYRQG